jgi:predicted TIM-barrel fold metal-dependent hydrolase
MFKTSDGDDIFVIDAHIHLWDARPENQRNIHGAQFINCFHDYHSGLSPAEYVWPIEKFQHYGAETLYEDVFVNGYADMAICQPTYLKDFYIEGFNTTEQNAELRAAHPDRVILNGAFDPRDGEPGLDALTALVETYNIIGVKLYTAEWHGDSKGYKLTDAWARRYLEHAQSLGIKNVHVHKGPTILPLNRDAFDVADIDDAATDFPELNFIVDHVGLPRLDDFCWIATQEKNVYGGLAVASAFVNARPRYFAEMMSELLFWVGEDKLLFASDYGIWQPKWLIEKFMAFEMPEDLIAETGVDLTPEAKRKILGLNAAKLYGIDVEAQKAKIGAG